MYWLSFATAAATAFALMLMSIAAVSIATMGDVEDGGGGGGDNGGESDFVSDSTGSTGAGGYQWGYRSDGPELFASVAVFFAAAWVSEWVSEWVSG